MAYEYNESGIESSYDIHDWSNNVIISDTRMDNIDKGIVNLYNAIFGNEAENINGIIHHFESKNNTVNNIIGIRPNDNNDTIFDNITNLWHNIKDESNLDENEQEISRTPYGRIVDLENNLGTRGNNNTAFNEINNLKNDLGTKGNNNKVFNEIETAKNRLTTLETNLGPAAQDAQNKNTAFDRIATLETNLETLTTNIQPDLKIIENSNIISIDDAAPLDAEEFAVDIELIQDLHGYDSPWPAGGGVNLLNPSNVSVYNLGQAFGLTWTWDSATGAATVSGTWNISNTGGAFRFLNIPSTVRETCNITAFSDSANFNLMRWQDGENVAVLNLKNMVENQSYSFKVYPVVYVGSTAPTIYSPYSNICPISGWTGANVCRTGKNLLKLDESEMVSNGWNRIFPVSLKAGTYILSCQNQFGTSIKGAKVNLTDENDSIVIVALTADYTFGDTTFIGATANITEEQADTIKNIRFALRAGGTTYNDIAQGNIQLELGSTATDYEPYVGQNYDIIFPTEAGIVCGGVLDMTNGTLTVDRGYSELDENWAWVKSGSYAGGYYANRWQQMGYKINTPFICSHAKSVASLSEYVNGTCYCDSSINLRIMDETSTLQDWKDYIAAQRNNGTPITICYELATPITYQLTPTAITLLRGNNNIWVDCGNITMKYWQDKILYENFYTKTQINNSLLPLNEITALDNRVDILENDLKATVKEEANQLINTNLKLTLPYQIANLLTEDEEYKIRLLDINYPVGSIYMSLNNTNPANILGGKWASISQGRVLIGAGTDVSDGTTTKTFTTGSVGGEYNHILSVSEMPAHNHNVYYSNTKGTETGSVLTRATKTKRKTASDVVINKGGNTGHNNIQPYLVCNIWQRVIEDIHDVMRAMDTGTYTYLFNEGNEVPLVIDDNTTIIMVIDQIDTEKNYVYFRQKYTEGMELCSNSAINDKLTSFQNSIPSDVKLALVGNPALPEATTLDGVEVWATSNQGDTEAQHYLLPRICLKTIDMGVSSNIVDAEDSGHSF